MNAQFSKELESMRQGQTEIQEMKILLKVQVEGLTNVKSELMQEIELTQATIYSETP